MSASGTVDCGLWQAGINDTIDFRFRFSAESKTSAFGRPLMFCSLADEQYRSALNISRLLGERTRENCCDDLPLYRRIYGILTHFSKTFNIWTTRVQGWGGGEVPKGMGCGEGVPLPRILFCFVISKWHILVNSRVLNLKYVIIILGRCSHWRPPNQNLGGDFFCVPGILGGVDANDLFPSSFSRHWLLMFTSTCRKETASRSFLNADKS